MACWRGSCCKQENSSVRWHFKLMRSISSQTYGQPSVFSSAYHSSLSPAGSFLIPSWRCWSQSISSGQGFACYTQLVLDCSIPRVAQRDATHRQFGLIASFIALLLSHKEGVLLISC